MIGAGAVGGYVGARLAQHGHDVHFLARSDYAQLKSRGFSIRSVAGDFTLAPDRFHVYDDTANMPQVDLVIVALKSTHNPLLPNLLPLLLRSDTTILTLQNGLGNEQFLADHFGASRIVGGIVFACINRVGPGRIDDQYRGFIRLGEFAAAGRSERAEQLVALFNASNIKASLVEDLRAGRWDKQVWNVPFNGLSALLDATTDLLIADQDGERVVRAIMEEVISAARADGVDLKKTPDPLKKGSGVFFDVAGEKLEATRVMGAYVTSTQLDRRQRKPMEVEAIFGQPVHIARRNNLHLPLLELLYFSLKRLDVAKVL